MVVAATEAVARVAVGAAEEEMAVGAKVEVTVVMAMVEGGWRFLCVARVAPGLRPTPSAPRPPEGRERPWHIAHTSLRVPRAGARRDLMCQGGPEGRPLEGVPPDGLGLGSGLGLGLGMVGLGLGMVRVRVRHG